MTATTTSADLPDNNNRETIHYHRYKVMLKKVVICVVFMELTHVIRRKLNKLIRRDNLF